MILENNKSILGNMKLIFNVELDTAQVKKAEDYNTSFN